MNDDCTKGKGRKLKEFVHKQNRSLTVTAPQKKYTDI